MTTILPVTMGRTPTRPSRRTQEKGTIMADTGFSKEEKAAMKERAAELRAEAKRQKLADKSAAEAQDAADAIAAMTDVERPIAQMVHEVVAEHAPNLRPQDLVRLPRLRQGGR